MKRIFIGLVAAFMLLSSKQVSAQALSEGNFVFDVYYGTPTFFQRVAKAFVSDSSNVSDIVNRNFGPIGLRAEYMASDQFGVGLDIGYNSILISSSRVEPVYNNTTGTTTNVRYDDKLKTAKIGVMATFNYHFLDNDQFDIAGVFGIGYGRRTFTYETTEPGVADEDVTFGILVPIALRVGVNMRYFFTENIGLNVGLGLGQGGLANAGISVKF